MNTSLLRTGLILVTLLGVSACSGDNTQPAGEPQTLEEKSLRSNGKLFGDLTFGGSESRDSDRGGAGIGVNGFLWRASLDTLAFLPLASADPFGGVIITDWYAPPESPQERFKVNVYLLGRQLRSDGVRVSVFRQTQSDDSEWIDSALSEETANRLEDAILTRARELRIASNPG